MIVLEESLKPIIIKNKSKIINSTFRSHPFRYQHIDEVDSSFGVVDLLFYKFNNQYIQKRKDVSPVTSSDVIKTLLFIKNKKTFSISYLRKNLPYSEERIKKILLTSLINHGFVKKLDKKNFETIFNYKIGLKKALAIELKLKDWKGGLCQAYRYKWFSEVSYLALYHKFSNPAKKNLDLFREYNVGLMEIFDNENIKIIFKPKVEKPFSKNVRAIASENLIKRLRDKKIN